MAQRMPIEISSMIQSIWTGRLSIKKSLPTDPKPQSHNPEPQTLNLKPETLNQGEESTGARRGK